MCESIAATCVSNSTGWFASINFFFSVFLPDHNLSVTSVQWSIKINFNWVWILWLFSDNDLQTYYFVNQNGITNALNVSNKTYLRQISTVKT